MAALWSPGKEEAAPHRLLGWQTPFAESVASPLPTKRLQIPPEAGGRLAIYKSWCAKVANQNNANAENGLRIGLHGKCVRHVLANLLGMPTPAAKEVSWNVPRARIDLARNRVAANDEKTRAFSDTT